MNFDNINKFIQLAKKEGVSKLTYEEDDKKISVSFETGNSQVMTSSASQARSNENKVNTVSIAEDIFHKVTSPFVGTFYRSASPDSDPFVKVGDRVTKGQTLCILEAMKIMNEIECDADGEIVEICSENENLVEYGQILFKIRT